jgi:hypothetical protein
MFQSGPLGHICSGPRQMAWCDSTLWSTFARWAMSITIIFYVPQNYSIPGGWRACCQFLVAIRLARGHPWGCTPALWRRRARPAASWRSWWGSERHPWPFFLIRVRGIPGTPPNFSASGDLSHLGSGGWASSSPQCVGEEERELWWGRGTRRTSNAGGEFEYWRRRWRGEGGSRRWRRCCRHGVEVWVWLRVSPAPSQ